MLQEEEEEEEDEGKAGAAGASRDHFFNCAPACVVLMIVCIGLDLGGKGGGGGALTCSNSKIEVRWWVECSG